MSNHIVKETQRESIVNRPHNLAGSVKGITKTRYNISETGIQLSESTTTPALLKLFMEALDNPIDVAIKSKQPIKIDIKVTPNEIQVKDNGYGIPSIKDKDDIWQAFSAFCEYNSSSNYKDDKGQGQKGVNGIGVKLCTTLSTKMVVDSDDGKKKIHIVATENNLKHKVEEKPSTGSGVCVKFNPDFNIFDVDEITPEHIQRMYEYTLLQALTYPDITFKFNNKTLKYTPKKFMSLLSPHSVIEEHDDYFVAVAPNNTDDFKQISYINGLETHLGGSHVEWVQKSLINEIRLKLQKKSMFKSIKPGDIKNKLLLVIIGKDMKNVDWDGQTKASITSPDAQMKSYFADLDFDKLANKVIKTPEIIDNVTEFFKIKEEMQKRKDLKGLTKKKRIKSEKYLPATKNRKVLFLAEGASAVGGLMPSLGRENYGYFELRGVPLNAYDATQKKFTNNPELSELFSIIQNEGAETYEDGSWFEIEVQGKTIIVNEHDTVKINSEWISVTDLLDTDG